LCLPCFDASASASASRPAASGAARVRRNSEPYFKDPQQSRWRRGGLPRGSRARKPRAVLQRLAPLRFALGSCQG
ncbi:MAG: hypothetical protein ACREYF_02915, partial [Gammaproteobacteria bacterium]